MKTWLVSLVLFAMLMGTASTASAAQPQFGKMAFFNHTSPSHQHHRQQYTRVAFVNYASPPSYVCR